MSASSAIKSKKVLFVWEGGERSCEVEGGQTLLDAAQKLGIPILTTCGGQASCSDCRIKVTAGMEQLRYRSVHGLKREQIHPFGDAEEVELGLGESISPLA